MAKRGFTTSSIVRTSSSIAQPQIQVTTVSIAKRYWHFGPLQLRPGNLPSGLAVLVVALGPFPTVSRES